VGWVGSMVRCVRGVVWIVGERWLGLLVVLGLGIRSSELCLCNDG
jgi:hypothetical protein